MTITDDLLAELEEKGRTHYCHVQVGPATILALIARIRELSEAQRWVLVGEKLPARGQEVLFHVGAYNEIHSGTWQDASFLEHDGHTSWPAHDDPRYGATHWMPAPSPPKEEA